MYRLFQRLWKRWLHGHSLERTGAHCPRAHTCVLQDEGVVVKDLTAPYVLNERSINWQKVSSSWPGRPAGLVCRPGLDTTCSAMRISS